MMHMSTSMAIVTRNGREEPSASDPDHPPGRGSRLISSFRDRDLVRTASRYSASPMACKE